MYEINAVLDVGAHIGQYAKELRNIGYAGEIISFEPRRSAYEQLMKNKQSDDLWSVYNFALGDSVGEAVINIAGNGTSSSIRNMLQEHLMAAPYSKYIGQETVKITKIDSIFASVGLKGKKLYLKIDTQGFEENVLKGAENSLQFINTIQIEMSLVPLYGGEILFPDMYAFLCGKKYQMVFIESGLTDVPTGRILQTDCIFHRF